MEIGSKIRQIRLQRDLTQEELASRCELTKGYISQLENDLASPSIATLMDILNVLGVSLKYFFSDQTEEQVVFTDKDFFVSEGEGFSKTWLVPNSQKNQMEPIILLIEEGGQSEMREPFEGEELGYVLEGKITIQAGGKQHRAKKGDSFYINGRNEHYIINRGKGCARILWVVTPSNF